MFKAFYKILSFFEFCDHKFKFTRLEMFEHKNKVITIEHSNCEKCDSPFRQYYFEDKK